jgi:hypothetical protein
MSNTLSERHWFHYLALDLSNRPLRCASRSVAVSSRVLCGPHAQHARSHQGLPFHLRRQRVAEHERIAALDARVETIVGVTR